jgi:pimeloyl-ACP methyl ester carboxylesterase
VQWRDPDGVSRSAHLVPIGVQGAIFGVTANASLYHPGMPDPQIRYARTSDGVNIAYWAMGSGVPLVMIDLPTSNVQYELAAPFTRTQHDQTAALTTLVRYDHRGFGVSDNTEEEFSTDAFVRDLEAVVDKLNLDRFLLLASRGPTYPIALAYARLHPDRILRIAAVLGGPPEGFVRAMLDVPDADWAFLTDTVARRVAGSDTAGAGELAEHLRCSTGPAGMRRFIDWFALAADPPGVEDVRAPCLLLPVWLGERDTIAEARALASRMPDAAVQPIVGASDVERAAAMRSAIAAFFAGGMEVATPRRSDQAAPASGTAVILFIDIADSTALTERMGDAAFRAASRTLDAQLRAAIRDAGGTPVDGKVMGDGVMATF